MRPIFLALLFAAASQAQIAQQIVAIQSGPSGPVAPFGFVSTANIVNEIGGFTYPITPALAISAGTGIAVAIGIRGTVNLCGTITGVTGTGGDTFTQSGNIANAGGFEGCAGLWTMLSPTPNASYSITLVGGAGSPSTFPYVILTFNKGTLAGTADGTCNNPSAGTTTITCASTGGSGVLTPTGTVALGLLAGGSYDNLSSSPAEADNSTPAFTLNSTAQAGNTTVGAIRLSYYSSSSPAGTLTPGFTHMGGGDPVAIWGAAWK